MENSKKGISLVVLIITIIIVMILASTIVINTIGNTDEADLMALENDMLNIKDNVLMYYTQNNTYPVIASESYTKEDINTRTNSLYKNDIYEDNFLTQANFSGDETFYKIDISKLDVIATKRGNGAKGELDYYLLALPSANVYYMMGEEINNKIMFSLNYVLGIKNNTTQQSTSTTSVIYKSDEIKVTYNKNLTNSLGIAIDVNMEENEKLYLLFQEKYTETSSNLKEVEIAKAGNNILKMDEVGRIYSVLDNISMNTGFVYDDSKPKIMNIIKKNGDDVVAIANIDLSNYDNTKPYIDEATKKTIIGATNNKISFRVSDSKNNIKEIRYDYLKKYDVNSTTTVNYYNDITSIDANYLKQNGKKATTSSDGLTEIILEKDISDISIVIIDNAGNVSNVYNYNIYGTVPYINATLTDYLFSKLSFDVYIYSTSTVSSVTAQISKDDVTYSNVQNLTISTQGNVSKASISFDKLSNAEDVFLKIIANESSTRILKFDI